MGSAAHTEAERVGARFGLSESAVSQLARLLDHLASDPEAPTTVSDPSTAADRHVADSLEALQLECVLTAAHIVDIGSGAGFPGLPLAVATPSSTVTLLESSRHKCRYLERAVRAAGVARASVAGARAEAWSPDTAVDVVAARALGPLPLVLEYAAPLLVEGGNLVAWKGRLAQAERAAGEEAAAALGLELAEELAVAPRPQARSRLLLRYRKVRPTPARFPRRPGVARRRPLGPGS